MSTNNQVGATNVNNAVFRPMGLEDVDAVLAIEQASFHTPWTREAFQQELTTNSLARYYVMDVEGYLAGYCGMWIIVDEAHITNVAVAPGFRRQGIGRRMMAQTIALLKDQGVERMTLEVRAGNIEAIALYKAIGFESAGIRPGYYTDTHEDAEIMWLTF